jgi:hypothetical protein
MTLVTAHISGRYLALAQKYTPSSTPNSENSCGRHHYAWTKFSVGFPISARKGGSFPTVGQITRTGGSRHGSPWRIEDQGALLCAWGTLRTSPHTKSTTDCSRKTRSAIQARNHCSRREPDRIPLRTEICIPREMGRRALASEEEIKLSLEACAPGISARICGGRHGSQPENSRSPWYFAEIALIRKSLRAAKCCTVLDVPGGQPGCVSICHSCDSSRVPPCDPQLIGSYARRRDRVIRITDNTSNTRPAPRRLAETSRSVYFDPYLRHRRRSHELLRGLAFGQHFCARDEGRIRQPLGQAPRASGSASTETGYQARSKAA